MSNNITPVHYYDQDDNGQDVGPMRTMYVDTDGKRVAGPVRGPGAARAVIDGARSRVKARNEVLDAAVQPVRLIRDANDKPQWHDGNGQRINV